jgi:ADP-heptose:LPS heptosyltransferase
VTSPDSASRSPRILVIKLSALGDFVLALGPAAAIRRRHADAHITLLTTPPFVALARASGYFDEIWTDSRPKLWQPGALLALRDQLRAAGFDRIYDLQTSTRSNLYFRLMGPGSRPEWSGIARGCSHPHANPERDFLHSIERQADQLRMAGIEEVPLPDLSWATADLNRFTLPGRYALLVPGASVAGAQRRWPAAGYAELAQRLAQRGLTPVLLGTAVDRAATGAVGAACATARDLTGDTSLLEIAALARGAAGAVGNDTGPMHLIAAAGCPSLVLFSAATDPVIAAPRPGATGGRVEVLFRHPLGFLGPDEVFDALVLRDA